MRVAVSTEAAVCDHFPSSQEILFVRLVISLLFSFRISMHISRALISDLSTSNSRCFYTVEVIPNHALVFDVGHLYEALSITQRW